MEIVGMRQAVSWPEGMAKTVPSGGRQVPCCGWRGVRSEHEAAAILHGHDLLIEAKR